MGSIIALVIFVVFLAIGGVVVKTPWFKGWSGELVVNLTLKLFLDKNIYHMLRDVTLPTTDGTTQIDHIIVSRFGLFVIETKNMAGAIYGSERDKQWTQAFGPKIKHNFMNPLHQNYKHTAVLAELLDLPTDKLKSIVMFVGDAKLKSKNKPENVLTTGLIRYIKSHKQEIMTREQAASILESIQAIRLERGLETNRKHVAHVKELKDQKASRS